MLDWSTKDSRQKWLFSSGFFDFHYMCPLADKRSTHDLICKPIIFLKSMGGGFSSSTYNGNPCLPPLENSLPCMAWVAWEDQSSTLWKCFIDSWHLDLRCHYLLNYPMNCCMHILFQHYIFTVIDEYTIHFDGSYWKYDEMVDQKEVNFSRGAHSTNPCGNC